MIIKLQQKYLIHSYYRLGDYLRTLLFVFLFYYYLFLLLLLHIQFVIFVYNIHCTY